MLIRCRRKWCNSEPTLGQCIVLSGVPSNGHSRHEPSPPPPLVQLPRKKCTGLYIANKEQSCPAHCVTALHYHKDRLSPVRSLVIQLSQIIRHPLPWSPPLLSSPAGVEGKFTLVTGSREYPLLISLSPSVPMLLMLYCFCYHSYYHRYVYATIQHMRCPGIMYNSGRWTNVGLMLARVKSALA